MTDNHTDNLVDPVRMLEAFDEVSPSQTLPPQRRREHRRSVRYNASWHIVIDIDGHESYQGTIKDISLHGAAILNGLNLRAQTPITLHIHIPSMINHGSPRIVSVHGKTSYTVHDNQHQCFRVGIAFVEFGLESDRAYLEARLSSYHDEAF